MVDIVEQIRYFFTNITGRSTIDVIAIHDAPTLSAFLSYCESMDIAYLPVSEGDAAKMLVAQDGIGFGCYTLAYTSERNRKYRAFAAERKLLSLSEYIGLVTVGVPSEVKLPDESVIYLPDLQSA